ncbi:hypothetical protein PoB_002451200 [Plakobranchus ocellatus]|uniref:Uncharacterized protein n=1 Tax=Plakobranchus ocellatus TaxID=259542 RepID=A0AAV3ZTL0_9GAST|nr:hypothetical protein PoB_002451200 [Plakobranchus ocellatus]
MTKDEIILEANSESSSAIQIRTLDGLRICFTEISYDELDLALAQFRISLVRRQMKDDPTYNLCQKKQSIEQVLNSCNIALSQDRYTQGIKRLAIATYVKQKFCLSNRKQGH